MIKEFIDRTWMVFTGMFSSLGIKGFSDILSDSTIVDTANKVTEKAIQHQLVGDMPPLITYFWIGVLGALGGLLIKILWGCLKKWFPKLKNIDK
jgi:hypothetical protein